jgi:hyperosmotically inducible protein
MLPMTHRLTMLAFCVLTISIASAVSAAQLGAVKDGWLVMKVHSEMVDEDLLTGSDIDVDVKNGVVTLQGTVPNEAARARALEVARKNDGVKNVVDQLKIAPARAGSTAGRVDRAGDRVAGAGEKAADKSRSAARSTGRAMDDGWIKSKIYAQYMADWNTVLDDSDIDVDVDNNVVTLSGTVKSAEAKAKAVATAKATDGVKSVRDMLKVTPR